MTTTLSWRACPSGPHLPLIAGATGAHNPNKFDAPDQGVDHGSGGPLGPAVGDQPNILPLDLNFFAFTHFITNQYIEHVSSSQLNCR